MTTTYDVKKTFYFLEKYEYFKGPFCISCDKKFSLQWSEKTLLQTEQQID
jgi:hypothetical protein